MTNEDDTLLRNYDSSKLCEGMIEGRREENISERRHVSQSGKINIPTSVLSTNAAWKTRIGRKDVSCVCGLEKVCD